MMKRFESDVVILKAATIIDITGPIKVYMQGLLGPTTLAETMMDRNISEHFGSLTPLAENDGPVLSTAQMSALQALLDGQTQRNAALAAGRSEKWLWHQMNQYGTFRDVLRDAQASRQRAIKVKALKHADSAIDAIVSIASDPEHKDRLKACQTILAISTSK